MEGDARKYAYRLLGYRDRSEKEIREKLLGRGFPEDVVSLTIQHLKKNGFVDDSALAASLMRYAQENKRLGYQGARQFMLRRGLSAEVIESALSYDENTELRNALKLIGKKTKNLQHPFTTGEKKKIWNFLVRRGYSLSTVRKAFRRYNSNEEEEHP